MKKNKITLKFKKINRDFWESNIKGFNLIKAYNCDYFKQYYLFHNKGNRISVAYFKSFKDALEFASSYQYEKGRIINQ